MTNTTKPIAKPNGWEENLDKLETRTTHVFQNTDEVEQYDVVWVKKDEVKELLSQAILSAEERGRKEANNRSILIFGALCKKLFGVTEMEEPVAPLISEFIRLITTDDKSLSLPDQEQLSNSKTK